VDRRRVLALSFAFNLLALPACSLEPTNVVVAAATAGPDSGGVVIDFSPTEPQMTSSSTEYRVRLDGRLVVFEDSPGLASPLTVVEGGTSRLAYLDPGPHHFTIITSNAHPVFDGDGQVASGGVTRLLLFGSLDDLSGRFVSTPNVPSTGNEHVTVVNLLTSNQAIQVMSCLDAATCTPMSPALALGDVFDTEVPAVLDGGGTSLTAAGEGVGYRLTPSDALPDPPLVPLDLEMASLASNLPVPPIFFAAPVYMSDDGQPQAGFN
jgi:hypothetical protein